MIMVAKRRTGIVDNGLETCSKGKCKNIFCYDKRIWWK